ncbi:aspartate/glutamate racemase family protein [Cohnella candidum]|uniref:Asp/Glu racemase n=1 Tax=Cohnella candidum TaxID=2674991 RepID=A0A3G3JVC3_9BACL|nr:aspartate/glutamate racemase family protein [Cohnella candidum]AYQ72190.1 Asp/Glu racemase [Cohnella candidum]
MKKPKLAIIHTTSVTVDSLKTLAAEVMPEWDIINFVDDSILPQLAANGGRIEEVQERWSAYARFAEQQGAACVVSACSSVGEAAEAARLEVGVPVKRIDEAMAEEAVTLGGTIGVAATLASTLGPTIRLIERKAQAAGKTIDIKQGLASEAYRLLMSGDREGHDRVLADMLLKLVEEADIVVLAQASMARVVSSLPEELRAKFLTSPRLGLTRIAREMAAPAG